MVKQKRLVRTLGLSAMFFGLLLLSHLTSHGSLVLAQAVRQSGASGQAQAVIASTPQGAWIQAWYSNQPPMLTGEQQRQLEERTARSHRSGPVSPTTMAPVGTVPGPTTPPLAPPTSAGSDVSAMPGDFIIFRDSVIPNAVSAFVQEPSTSANGKNVFQVGNWYAARSFDNGATWNFLDPFSIFGPDFCCDQVTIYDPGRDRQFWLLQYGDHLAIANSSGTDLFTNWCVYNIDPTWIGQPATTALDYNDLALGTNYLYLTTNIFPAAGGAGSAILRLPIDALITCGAFGYNYTVHMDSFTFKPVQGAQDVMYWGSNWGQLNGQSFRVYSWAENSGTYFWFDRTIDAFTFMFRNSGQYCGSADGLVTNWCQFADSRVLSGYRANGILGFSFNVSQGSGFPFPYSRRVYFRESDIAYLGATALWAEWSAIQYLQLTPNARGHIGGVFAWGGGTTTNFYPGTGLLIDDDVSPVQPWAVAFPLFGGGNTCTFDGLSRWGDYLTVQRFHPVGNAWVAAGFAIQGAHCGTTDPAGNPLWYSEPHNYIFGRGRDSGSVDRWWDT